MASLALQGISRFVYVETAADTWQMVGCCNSISENESSNEITVNCDQNGIDPITEYGTSSYSVTLGGVVFLLTSGEEATQYSVEDFRAARKAGTKLKIRVGDGTSTGKKGDEYQNCMIASIDKSGNNGQQTTYNIQLKPQTRVTYSVS